MLPKLEHRERRHLSGAMQPDCPGHLWMQSPPEGAPQPWLPFSRIPSKPLPDTCVQAGLALPSPTAGDGGAQPLLGEEKDGFPLASQFGVWK